MKKRVSLYFINGFGPCSLRHLFLRVTGASLFIYFISIPGRKSFADQISRCKGNKRIPSFSVAHRSANAHRVILLSPPLVLAKKLMNSHPVSTEKQMTRCNPCPFNSINRPSYEIMVPSVDLWLVLTEPAELYLGQPSDSTSIAEESKTSLSPLRC